MLQLSRLDGLLGEWNKMYTGIYYPGYIPEM